MADLVITSAGNPRLKQVLALRRRRGREETGETIVEGFEELSLAVAAGHVPRAVFVCPELFSPSGYAGAQAIGSQEDLVAAARDAGAQIVRLSRGAFQKVAYREGPDGLLGVVPAVGGMLSTLSVAPDALVLLAEGIEKPGNLGAVLRTADAVGATAVVAVDPVTDWGNPNVVRASKGTVFAVPVASTEASTAIEWVRAHGLRLVVATPEADALHTDVDYTVACAVAVGGEKHGASGALLAAADDRVRIPMAGHVNSLNVATAAAVVLYEAHRQRGSKRLHSR
jgi:TrmH family RNA methyltransferase